MSFEPNTINAERVAKNLKSACDDLSTMMHMLSDKKSRSVEDLELMASLAAEIDEIISCYDTSCLIDNSYLCECGSLVIEYRMRFTENKKVFDERKCNFTPKGLKMEIVELVVLLNNKMDAKAREMEEAANTYEANQTEDSLEEMHRVFGELLPVITFIYNNSDFAAQVVCGPRKIKQAMKTKRGYSKGKK